MRRSIKPEVNVRKIKLFNLRPGRVVLGFAIIAAFVSVFQNCSGFSPNTFNVGGTSSFTLQSIGGGVQFSNGYQPPASRQGASDGRMDMSAADADARYAKLKSWGAGYRQYNIWWSEIDDTGVAASVQPQACDANHVMVPANEGERQSLGYHKFRCASLAKLASMDQLFSRDQANGMQSGIVMYSTPAVYRDPNCQGFDFGGNHLKDGCVPREDAMDDFEDYANLLASRYNGGDKGKISHFIVWNENASPDWFDYTPTVSKTSLAADQVARRVDKYADMLKRVHAALSRHQHKALMYVSTDQLWYPGKAPGHMGTIALLQGLWDRLGTNYSWSVAVHPYGNVDAAPARGIYTFNNLEIVSQFQAAALAQRGVADPSSYPQYQLIASEQGWPERGGDRANQARQICLAHAKVTSMPNVVAVGHNYFHSAEPNDRQVGGASGQGAFFGLIPYEIPNSLAGAENTDVGQAFMSTMDTSKWGVTRNHFCCQYYNTGCGTGPIANNDVIGNIDGVSADAGVITGWACTAGVEQAIAVHVYLGGPAGSGHVVSGIAADQAGESAIANACGTQGSAHRFAFTLGQDIRAQFAGQTIFVHGISAVGRDNSLLNNSGKFRVPQNPVVAQTTTAADPATLPREIVYRLYGSLPGFSDHLMTLNPNETDPAYHLEGGAFAAIARGVSDPRVHPIFRCLANGNQHFVSIDPACEGFGNEGVLGQLLNEASPGARPVYRYYQPSSGDHLATVNPAEAIANGFNLEYVLGYAF